MELLSQLKHLWPDFSALLSGDPSGLVALFWVLLLGIFLVACFQLISHRKRFYQRIGHINELLDGQDKGGLAQKRRETEKKAFKLDDQVVGPVWREFDETLVLSGDPPRLHNTLDADHFFNARTLARGLTANRLLAAAPSFLVATGVLGTFVGLTIGLDSLNLGSQSGVEALRDGIHGLIQGAAIAFMTSVWGVGLSLLLNIFEKYIERRVLGAIVQVQQRIDYLYPRIPAEQTLVTISDSTHKSSLALQELHERIGDRLQESLEGVSSAMQEAISEALNKIMAPAIDSLVQNANQQSSDLMGKLVGQFIDGVGEAGRSQTAMMEKAAEGMNDAMVGMVEKLNWQQQYLEESNRKQAEQVEAQVKRMSDASAQSQAALQDQFSNLMERLAEESAAQTARSDEREQQRREAFQEQISTLGEQQKALLDEVIRVVEQVQEQSRQMAGRYQDLVSGLERASKSVANSSERFDSSATRLGELASHVEKASALLGERMPEVAQAIEEASAQNAKLAEQQAEQGEILQGIQRAVETSIEEYGRAAKLSNEGMEQLRRHQEEWLKSIADEFKRLGGHLRDEVSGIEKQASNWLKEYSDQVNAQLGDRMETWNKHSREYAQSMLSVAQTMSSVVDELETR